MADSSAAWAGLMRLANGYQITQALHVAATLGVADALKEGARNSDDLAAIVGAHPGALYRLLRALASVGVFHEGEGHAFSLTEMGACLCRDANESVAPWAAFVGRPYIWQAWAGLLDSVRTGENAFRAVHGVDVWTYRAGDPQESAIFDAAMAGISRGVTEAAVAAYDFERFARIVDVGGGTGALLGGILAANPGVRGVLLDQPHVVAGAGPVLERLGVASRCELVGGNFFVHVPRADLCVLKAVLHDWDDENCLKILRQCRQAVGTDGKVVVLERLIGAPNDGPVDKFSDLNMLVAPGGQERTEAEFADLFAQAELRLVRVVGMGMRMSLLEAAAG